MKTIESSQFKVFCNQSGICIADPKLNIGMELTYCNNPLRTIVVHIIEADIPEHLIEVLRLLFTQDTSWLVVARFGFNAEWGIPFSANEKATAISFEALEAEKLPALLSNHMPRLRSLRDDLYVLGHSGNIILTFDHHIDEGMEISINDIDVAARILVGLNSAAAEVELFSKQKAKQNLG